MPEVLSEVLIIAKFPWHLIEPPRDQLFALVISLEIGDGFSGLGPASKAQTLGPLLQTLEHTDVLV